MEVISVPHGTIATRGAQDFLGCLILFGVQASRVQALCVR